MNNPYLRGNYGPVSEEHTAFDLSVTGSIPDYLDGRYLRIGPNPVTPPESEDYHWFLGDGMTHGVRLADGEAKWYRNRFVRSATVADALGEARPPRKTYGGLDLSPNTNIVEHAGRTLALIEGGSLPYELTDELETVGACDFDGTLPGGYTAHPHRDPVTGELHAIAYFWGWGNKVRYTVTGTDGRVRRSVDVEVKGSPMMHDFSLTENYVLIYDLPVTFDTKAAAKGQPLPIRPFARATLAPVIGRVKVPDPVTAILGRTPAKKRYGATSFPYTWNSSYPARVGVLPRDGSSSDVRWFDLNPCYVFHPLNAYEDGDTIVADVVRHERVFDAARFGPADALPSLDHWTIDLAAGKVIESRFDDRPQEFPRIDERRTGRRHRYGYSVGVAVDEDSVIKHDLVSGSSEVHRFGAGHMVSEFCFVPRDNAAAEDDGVLIGFVYDATSDTSDLAILDAQTMESVGTVQLPARVPQGFHGSWAPSAS